MADKTTRLTAPGGPVVSVPESKADELRRRGFTDAETKTTSRRTSSTSNTSK